MSMHSDGAFERKFAELLGLSPSGLESIWPNIDSNGTLDLNKIELNHTENLAVMANKAVIMPIKDAVRKEGLKQIYNSLRPSIDARTQGKHIAIISNDFFGNSITEKELSILSGAVVIDGQLLPVIPAWLTSRGQPIDFGPQTESFEHSSSCAAIVTTKDKQNVRCGIIASEHTHRQLKLQLKKACTNVGLWQGANGHGFVNLLYAKSGLFGLIGWSIDQANQKIESRSIHSCIGFSSIDTSSYPHISGVAIIDPNPNSISQGKNTAFYEIAFEASFDSVWEIEGLDREVLQMIAITKTSTFGYQSIQPNQLTKVESWIANAKPGSYLHTRAIYQADGNSELTAQKLLTEHQKDEFDKLLE